MLHRVTFIFLVLFSFGISHAVLTVEGTVSMSFSGINLTLTPSVVGDDVVFSVTGTHPTFDGLEVSTKDSPEALFVSSTANFSSSTIYYFPGEGVYKHIRIRPTATGLTVGQSGEINILWSVDNAQICVLSPAFSPVDLPVGAIFSGNASGSRGGVYNISVTSSIGSASINSSTGAFTIASGSPGVVNFKVWISAAGAYLRSNDAPGTAQFVNSGRVKISIPPNNTPYAIEYKLKKDGEIFATWTQAPGASGYIGYVPVPLGGGTGGFELEETTKGVKLDGASVVAGGSTDGAVTNRTPVTPGTHPPGAPPLTPGVITPVTGTNDDGRTVTTTPLPVVTSPVSPKGPVWSPPVAPVPPSEQTDLLTNKVYREGVDRLTNQLVSTLPDELPSPADPEDTRHAKASGLISASRDLLPSAPQIIAPTMQQSSVTLFAGKVGSVDVSGSFDFSQYSTQIAIFRALVSATMLVIFTIVFVKTIRGAFAS